MIFKELTLNHPEWKNALQLFKDDQKDIFFLPNWYSTWLEHEKATAHCLHISIDDYDIIYPFLKSRIEGYDLGEDYFDIQTAYGYGGVIANKDFVPNNIIEESNRIISDWLLDNKVVAEFIRVHPLLDKFKRNCNYSPVRTNVFIETNLDYKIPDKQARQNVSKALSLGAEVIYDSDLTHLDIFIKLYRMTAERVKMEKYYHFDDVYFTRVKEELIDYSTLIHIVFNEKIIGSGLYLLYGNRATLHLVGSNSGYQHIRINDLLYYGAINLSIKNRASTLNVGGGLSLNREDSLFKFKRKYSHNFKDVYVGKNILNPTIYNQLINQWSLRNPELVNTNLNYFLKYRLKNTLQLEGKQLY